MTAVEVYTMHIKINVSNVFNVLKLLNCGVINLCPHSDTIGGKTTIKYSKDAKIFELIAQFLETFYYTKKFIVTTLNKSNKYFFPFKRNEIKSTI